MPTREEKQLKIVTVALTGDIEKAVKRISLGVVAELKKASSEGGTPVDTGWARANWVPSIGAPHEGTVGERPPKAEEGRAQVQADDSASVAGVAEVAARYTLNRGPVFISNNVPYIQALNDGHSKQAPAGFVQAAVIRAAELGR